MFRLFLAGNTSTIKAVHYSFNDDDPKLEMPVPTEKFGARTADQFYLPVNSSVKFASLRVTYNDGTESKVVKFFRD